MSNSGPYFVDQDGDTGIIGPGIHAEAPDGCAAVDMLDEQIANCVVGLGGDGDDVSETVELIHDHVIALMNLAYAEGLRAEPGTAVLCVAAHEWRRLEEAPVATMVRLLAQDKHGDRFAIDAQRDEDGKWWDDEGDFELSLAFTPLAWKPADSTKLPAELERK